MKRRKVVKFIEDANVKYLTKNRTYSVIKEDEDYYFITDDTGRERLVFKYRFEEVEESSPQQEVEYYEVIKKVPLSGYKPGTILHRIESFDEYAQYPEFFKPHYKAQFKVGDKVTDDGKNIYTVREIRNTMTDKNGVSMYFEEMSYGYRLDIGPQTMRHATAEEIEAASVITIGGYKMKYNPETNTVHFSNKGFTKAELLAYKRLMSPCISATITIRGEEITLDKLNQILDKLK